MKLHRWTEDQSPPDLEGYRAERALQMGMLDAILRARKCGTDFIVEEAGEVKHLGPSETYELERQALANLKRLNQLIADTANQPQESAALILKDRPKS